MATCLPSHSPSQAGRPACHRTAQARQAGWQAQWIPDESEQTIHGCISVYD